MSLCVKFSRALEGNNFLGVLLLGIYPQKHTSFALETAK